MVPSAHGPLGGEGPYYLGKTSYYLGKTAYYLGKAYYHLGNTFYYLGKGLKTDPRTKCPPT